jgi:hypothetical protein
MAVEGSADSFFLDASERALVAEVLGVVARASPDQGKLLDGSLARLRSAAQVIRESPSIKASWHARDRSGAVSGETLVDLLCRVPDYDLDLHIPTKAVLGQAYLVAKINFFKALGYALESRGAPAQRSPRGGAPGGGWR